MSEDRWRPILFFCLYKYASFVIEVASLKFYSMIEIDKGIKTSGTVQVQIFDSLGGLIHNDSTIYNGGKFQTLISLDKHPSGTYLAKCSSEDFEAFFKIIKI